MITVLDLTIDQLSRADPAYPIRAFQIHGYADGLKGFSRRLILCHFYTSARARELQRKY